MGAMDVRAMSAIGEKATDVEPCPKGRTDYEECFAPFHYCPEKGCGRRMPVATAPPTFLDGLRAAREAVLRQTDLTELVHFERPSDFRKGVLTCLAAVDAVIDSQRESR